jgi:hypothetical protein
VIPALHAQQLTIRLFLKHLEEAQVILLRVLAIQQMIQGTIRSRVAKNGWLCGIQCVLTDIPTVYVAFAPMAAVALPQ